MESETDDISDNELDYLDIWKTKKNAAKPSVESSMGASKPSSSAMHANQQIPSALFQKYEHLKQRSNDMLQKSKQHQQRTEKWRAQRLIKKACRDPQIRKMVESKEYNFNDNCSSSTSCAEEQWNDIKPFLTVNDHLHGPVSHGDCGPKTELETLVDEAIKEGDFAKAELLSDTLANRQFAVKIAHAFKAKRFAEKRAVEEENLKVKRLKKLPWGFETKERWQMKGNM